MYEHGQIWTAVGPDGTTIVFNDGLSGLYLEDITGFDSADVRQNVEVLPEADGAVAGNGYYGSRPVTLNGKVIASTAAERNNVIVNMQRALRGLRGDIVLKSQPSGLPAMQATARLTNVRVTGGYVKNFLISLVCPDPRFYSQTVNITTATGVTPTPGASFPWAFPVNFGGGSGATLAINVTNAGNFPTPPTIRIYGPAAGPQIVNAATGDLVDLYALTLAAGEYVDLDFSARTVVRNDGANQYANVRFPGSTWFNLEPGSTTVQIFAVGAGATTGIDVSWRDAWA